MFFLAEVSDKLPSVAALWIAAGICVLIGIGLTRLFKPLGYFCAVLCATLGVLQWNAYDAADPFWQAVREELGPWYIVQSWLLLVLAALAIVAYSLRDSSLAKWLRTGSVRGDE